MSADVTERFDAVVIGAGFAGLYSLHRLRDTLGLKTRVYDAADGVGGTWHWNRYPGARCDIESYWYSYSFDEDLQQEWEWSEHFAAQPEILRYLNHVADRFDLRRDIQVNTRVVSAHYDEDSQLWIITTDDGDRVSTRFLISALGNLSSPRTPDFAGIGEFEGEVYGTARWPKSPVDFTGRRVAVIGTGASGIQAIPLIAEQADQLTVFQRTANFATPLQNRPLTSEESARIKTDYASLRQRARENFAGIPYDIEFEILPSTLAASPAERTRVFEERYAAGSFRLPFGSFADTLTDMAANEIAAEFVRQKIQDRVDNPDVAELLMPRSHPYGTRRTPFETDYYETFNRENVELVDARATPIIDVTRTGLRTRDRVFDVDDIVVAIGFDAMTGPLMQIDVRGRGGERIQDRWRSGPRTYLGLVVSGFPNLFVITGPQSPSVWYNMPTAIEDHVDFTCDCIAYMLDLGVTSCEARAEAEDNWVSHVKDLADQTLVPKAESWYMGSNIPGKPRTCMVYLAGAPAYRALCADVVADGYAGFEFRQ